MSADPPVSELHNGEDLFRLILDQKSYTLGGSGGALGEVKKRTKREEKKRREEKKKRRREEEKKRRREEEKKRRREGEKKSRRRTEHPSAKQRTYIHIVPSAKQKKLNSRSPGHAGNMLVVLSSK